MKVSEENRELIIRKTKEDVQAYLSKVEQKVRDLEVATEADKIVKKIAIDAEVKKVDQKRNEQLEKRIKELQDHEDSLPEQDDQEYQEQSELEAAGAGEPQNSPARASGFCVG